MNSMRTGSESTGRKHVHDAAADAELAVLVYGILTHEAGFDELFGQQLRPDVHPGREVQRGRGQLRRRHEPRQQRRRRDHDHPRLARRDVGQRTGAR